MTYLYIITWWQQKKNKETNANRPGNQCKYKESTSATGGGADHPVMVGLPGYQA